MREQYLAAVRARLERVTSTQDLSTVLHPGVPGDVQRLSGLLRDGDGDTEARLALGWMHYYRYLALPEGPDRDELRSAVTLLLDCFVLGVEPLPEQLLPILADLATAFGDQVLRHAIIVARPTPTPRRPPSSCGSASRSRRATTTPGVGDVLVEPGLALRIRYDLTGLPRTSTSPWTSSATPPTTFPPITPTARNTSTGSAARCWTVPLPPRTCTAPSPQAAKPSASPRPTTPTGTPTWAISATPGAPGTGSRRRPGIWTRRSTPSGRPWTPLRPWARTERVTCPFSAPSWPRATNASLGVRTSTRPPRRCASRPAPGRKTRRGTTTSAWCCTAGSSGQENGTTSTAPWTPTAGRSTWSPAGADG